MISKRNFSDLSSLFVYHSSWLFSLWFSGKLLATPGVFLGFCKLYFSDFTNVFLRSCNFICISQVVAFLSLVFRQVARNSRHLFNLVLTKDIFEDILFLFNLFLSFHFSFCFTFSSVIRSCTLLFLS